jgi:dipeptidyl aminopeptidase/acylaminoacyl peptidase
MRPPPIAVASFFLSLPSLAGVPGGTAADYERAARLPGELAGLVRNESIDARWIDAATLEWAWTAADGSRERRRIDIATGAIGVADGPVGELAPRKARRSRDGGASISLTFANRLDVPLRLAWLDRRGERRDYGEIAPGQERRQQTFAGHAWVLLGPGDEIVAGFVAPSGDATANVDEAMRETYRDLPDSGSARGAGRGEREPGPSAESPDGVRRIRLDGGNLVLVDSASGAERRLTDDGGPGRRHDPNVHWSPDGRFLAAISVDPVEPRTIPIVEAAPEGSVQPRLESLAYPKPGDPIDRVRISIFDAAAGTRIPVDHSTFANPWSIDRVAWNAAGDRLTFVYQERGHQVRRLVAIDVPDGGVAAIIDEWRPTFIDYSQKTFLRRLNGDRAIWMTERSGWNHLELVDLRDGTVRPLTAGEWAIRAVDDVRENADGSFEIRFRAMGVRPGEDPYHVHVGRLPVAADGAIAPITWLTAGDGTHELAFAPDGEHYVDRWSRVDLAPVHELRRTSDGSLVATLAEADASALAAKGWRAPERFVAPGRDGATPIHGIIVVPSDFDPSARYPVIEHIYAGPQDHFVPKAFSTWLGMRDLAELGFVVVQVDGMGTNWRSKAFHDVASRNLADAGLPDRIAWLKAAAATRPWMDLDRVGIYGGSAGGQNALGALLFHGDFYDVAVADCGCHDNRVDKMWWNEAWMGYPVGPHYAESSNVTHAHRLRGELMLIVGGVDRNVDPASTMQVVDALVKADRDFELLVLPGAGHGAAETPYGRRRRADFLVRKLWGVEPRRTVAINSTREASGPGR